MKYGNIKLQLVLMKQNNDGNLSDEYYDYSKYLQVGAIHTLNLDDTLDRINLSLVGLPFRHELNPTSLLRLIVSQEQTDDDLETIVVNDTFDFALDQDDVEQPNLADNNYFIHNLSLVNPAIIAQQRVVDNISVTYKLQNVVTTSSSVDLVSKLNVDIVDANYDRTTGTGIFTPNGYFREMVYDGRLFSLYNAYAYAWKGVDITYPVGTLSESNQADASYDDTFSTIRNINQNILYDVNDDTITFDTPLLACYEAIKGTKNYRFKSFMPITITIYDLDISSQITTETSYLAVPSRYIKDNTFNNNTESLEDGLILESSYHYVFKNPDITSDAIEISIGYDNVNDILVNNEPQNRTISIQTQPNHSYTIRCVPYRYGNYNPYVITKYTYTNIVNFMGQFTSIQKLNEQYQCYMQFTFNVLDPNNMLVNMFQQADQIDAYYLFQKAQLSTLPIRKTLNKPYYNSDLPFIVSESDKNLLKNTKLIESDFVGKNLWEIFTEIGKYIHAKPYITFDTYGYNDFAFRNRFIVNFLKYGSPEFNTKETTTNSIFNSKFAQEYISSLTTYVENYFNLGSEVTEYLHTSSESEDGLVYNDVVKLRTKYPILEVLKLYAYDNNGVERDITTYLFEYNIYKLLGYGNTPPSKSMGIYYHLGSKQIEGMQFVEPKSTGVECAYSMKRILDTVFAIGNPDNVQVNQFYFKLVYRTKDNVRIEMTRPDLRKYLLNSTLDLQPIHTQFNQQQDKLVNSDLLGLNTYGKLIRTGNSTYSYVNWCDDITKVMKNGDLYLIDNQMYYVSKTSRVYYSDHIEENVELTQDFNRLSQIIGIPSEPRFYEISEKNVVNRDVSFNDYIQVDTGTTFDSSTVIALEYMQKNCINEMFYSAQQQKYALTFYKGDADKEYDTNSNDSNYQTLLPINTFFSKTTYTLEWDNDDNYSAGEQLIDTAYNLQWSLNLYSILNFLNNTNFTQAYMLRNPTRYVDVFGRADLVDFVILKELPTLNGTIDKDYINTLPQVDETDLIDLGFKDNVFGTTIPSSEENLNTTTSSGVLNAIMHHYLNHNVGYILAKDNREKISFNYNIQMLANTDKIVFGDKMWLQDYTDNFYIVFLDTELNKFSANEIDEENIVYKTSAMNNTQIIIYEITYGTGVINGATIYNSLTDSQKEQIKSFAVVRVPNPISMRYQLVIGANGNKGDDFTLRFSKYNKDTALTNRKQIEKYL